MSARRRAGSWQDEVARSFSRLFSRGSSQDKEEDGATEEPDKSDKVLSRAFFRSASQDRGPREEQERGPREEQDRGPSRLFLRKVSAENGGARGPQEEQERARGFSRLFSRTSSQEKQEEDQKKSRAGEEDQHRHEEKNSDLAPDSHERLSSNQTEEVNEDQSSSSPHQVTSESEEEKDIEYREHSKVLDSEKQSRENFFHFIGNLFHFTPKTPLGNAKQVDSTQDLCKEHEDVQVKNNLDKEDSQREHTQDVSTSETEQTAEFSPAQAEPSVESNTEPPKETIKQEQQETPTSGPKINGHPQEAPAVTYGTYRGSRRIRKLLKRRADVNSPIPEKEETSEKETGSTGDIGIESCHMLHEIVSMEPTSYRSSEEEMPPSKIQIKMKMQPMGQVTAEIVGSNSQEVEVLKHKGEDCSIICSLSQNSELDLHEDEDLKRNAEFSSIASVPSQMIESNLQVDNNLNRNADHSSIPSVPSWNRISDLQEDEGLKRNSEDKDSSILSDTSQTSELDFLEDEDLKQNTEGNSIGSTSSQKSELDLQEDEDLTNADDSSIISDLQEDEDLKRNAQDNSIISVTSQTSELDLQEYDDLKKTAEVRSISFPSQNSESDLHEDKDLKQNVDVGSLVAVLNHNGESNSHEDMPQKPDIISIESVPKQNESLLHEVEENVDVNFDFLKRQETHSLDISAILGDMQQSTEESSEISNNVQLHAEETSNILDHSFLDNVNSSNASAKEFQPCSETKSNISENLHSKAENKSGCSVELVSSVLSKMSSDLPQGAEKSSYISQSRQVNTEKSLDSSKDLQSSFDHESDFSFDLSPHNDDVVYQTNSEERLEDLQPNGLQQNIGESVQISGDVQSKVEKSPIILEHLQINSSETSKILKTLQPNKDEKPKNLHELKQVFENSSTVVEGNYLDLQPLPTESVTMSKNVSQILNTKNLDSRDNVEILEIQPVNLENSTKISFDPHLEEIKLANLHKVKQNAEGSTILAVPTPNSESYNNKDLKQNVHVSSLVSVLNHENVDSKENVEILEILQINPENRSKISFDPHLEEIKLAVNPQNSPENTSFTQDLQKNVVSKNMQKEHQSEQLNNKINREKPEENLDGTVTTESPLASDKSPTQEESCNAESNLDNQQFIEVEHLKGTELQLNPSEIRNVSEQPHPTLEDIPKITAELQPYECSQLDIQKDLQQLEETNTNVISEAAVDYSIQSRDVSLTEQKIVMNGDLTGKDNFQLNKQGKSIIIDKTLVNAQPDLKILKEPQTNTKGFQFIAEEQQSNVETSDTFNDFHLIPSTDDDTSEIISVIDNAQGENKSEDVLNNGSSHVIETVRTVSFDNGIECRSPSPTISGSPSSTDCTDIRCDSPLPLSDAIDSGMVSSQAYTPEEHIPIKILPSDIFSKSISDPFYISQEDERTGHVESIVENEDNTLPVLVDPFFDYGAKKQNKTLIEEAGSQVAAKSFQSVERVLYVDNGGSDVDGDVSDRHLTNEIKKLNLNSDVYVAKVSVKSVNIEEVKLAPCEFRSDIISISKVESATYDKELIRVPDFSPPPAEPEYDSKFEDSNSESQQDEENIVTNTEVPTDRNIKDLTVNNANLSFHEPGLFLDFNKYEKSPYNSYMEAERFPSLKKINVVENVVNMFSNDYVSDNVPQYTYLEKGLPTLPAKSPDVLIENLKNNNLRIGTSDDIINISLQTNTSESELANESSMSDDSHWELQSCDLLSESHPNDNVTHKEPVKERDVILQSTFQRDVNCTDGMNSLGTASKMSIPSTELSVLSSELFEQKANEIIFSVLNSAIDEFQNLNKNHIPSLGTEKETLVESHLFHILESHSGEAVENSSKNVQNLITDPVISTVASKLVSDVIYTSKQFIQNNLDKTNGINNDCTQTSMVSVNGKDEDTRESIKNIPLLHIDSSKLFSSHEVNSNLLQENSTCDLNEGTEEGNDLKWTRDTKEELNDFRPLDKEALQNRVCIQDDSVSNLEAMVQDDTDNQNQRFDLGRDGDQEGYYSKSLETEGSMSTPFINNLSEIACTSGTEFIDPFQFSLYNSKYVEIESDDESTEEESGNNGQTSATDMFLIQSRRVRIYPLSLSPIYEDDSSCEDAVSNSSSPRYKKGTATGGGSNDPTSILSLLQSVSDRLKEANMEEVNMTSFSEAAAVSDLDNTDASGTQEDKPAPPISYVDPQKMLLEETSGEKKSSLFITKAENKVNLGSGRQSFLTKPTTFGSKPSMEINPAAAENESSPSAKSESSSIPNKDVSADVISVTALSPLQMVTDSGLSAPKPEIKCQPRMSSQSVYYQYFHSAQNSLSAENKESPTEEKAALPAEGESKEIEHQNSMDSGSGSLKFNPRPGKVILSDVIHHENKIELKGDALDATSWVFPNGVNIRVIRGCWIMYEKPHFEGQAHVLEEGEAVLLHLWDPPGARAKPDKISIGSVKRVVKDYLPEVVISPLEGTSDCPVYIHTEVPSLENLVDKRPRSLTVNSGVWLTYTEPQYNGTVSVLEEGCELPQIQACGVKSMRPLKMGGLKVQLPNDPKIIIYEKPHFQGWSREITEHVSNIGKRISDGDNSDPVDVGSIRVVGGIWVGYEKERYKGYQYLLEEGEYDDWQAWGGYSNTLQSIRYLQANFLEASVTLLESDSEDGKHVDLFNQAIPDLELAGYNTRPQCIHVKKGMWVAYQQKNYCGQQYILEKGRYKSHIDWGGSSNTIMSIRPVLLEPLGRNEVKYLIKAYENTNYQGESVDLTQQVSDLISFMPKSFKVLRGCWLLCYQANGCDNVCVLEEGHFPDLAFCGCPAPEIKNIQPIDYVFAEPSISLFALDSCEGRELHFEESVTSVLSEELHFYTQSVWVRRGLWIAFECANFLGRQMLLDPQQIPNWSTFSGWKVIGSLRPLKQPAVYFMVRNRHRDKYLTVTGKLSDSRATFVSISSRNGQSSQIWYFSRGFLKSKANDSCLDVIGGKNIPGSKVSLWAEHGKTRQKWMINKDGTISSYISDELVLDVKGGNYYDQNYLIVNKAQESSLTQKWDIEIL